ncbi:MAG: hypothetical protein ACI9TY_000429 [Alphaproteobacteria bacterium]|jgi:hypothetical protein
MQTINLYDLVDHITTKEWQRIAISMQTLEIYKKLTLKDYHNILGFNPLFFCLLKEEICGEALTEKLDHITLHLLENIANKTSTIGLKSLIDDLMVHMKSKRKVACCEHKGRNSHSPYDTHTTYHNGGNTIEILKFLADSTINCDPSCYITSGYDFIIYKLLYDIAAKNWQGVFNSFAFMDNPEKAIKALDNGCRTYSHPSYTLKGVFTSPLITQQTLEHVFTQKVF